MTRFLWTGESEFCICGHHITDHETLQWPISLTEGPNAICRGGNKVLIINRCHCDEFRPYRRTVGVEDEDYEEEEAIEYQNTEVIQG